MSRSLTIDSRLITDDGDCYVIAEIGQNHQGDVEKAKQLFHAAKQCGADAVKLQKRDNRSLYTRAMYESPYENENSFGSTYGEHREALEFGREEYAELKRYTQEIGITLFATGWDYPSVDLLAELEMPAFKVASGDLTNTPLLKYIAKLGKPMIVSTGGGSIEDVQRAYDAIMPINSQLCLLQCVALYPIEPQDMNLRVIETLRSRFPDVTVGLSDHQDGIAMSVLAYALGARVVEKHFTLHRSWKGTDHAFSLEPIGLQKLVRDLHRARLALGSSEKVRLPAEDKALFKMSKKLVAARDLPAGQVLRPEDIAIKSPGDGLPPYEFDNVLGKATLRSLQADEGIAFEDLQAAS
jgi:N-acetylneuraminate synthase/sialic acid synthase